MVVNIDKFIDAAEAGTLAGGFAVAPVSWSPEVIRYVSGPPTVGTLAATQIITHDHADAVTSGVGFEFTVPDNYDAGPLELSIVYAMSSAVASPNNVVVLQVAAEIADVTGGAIDTMTYAASSINLTTPDNSTNVARSVTILTIAEGDFSNGDKLIFTVERLGGDGGDLHTGSLKLVDLIVTYDGQVAPSVNVHEVEVFSDTAGTPAVVGSKGSFVTLDFQEGFNHEQKFQFTVPDNWDGRSDFHVRFSYAMTSAGGGNVRFNFSGSAASVNTGLITSLPIGAFVIPTYTDTDPHRTTVVYPIPGIGRTKGDVIVVVITRVSGDPLDTHTGDFQLIGTTVSTGQAGSVAVAERLDEFYITHRNYRNVTGAGVTIAQESPDFSADFETWTLAASTVPGGQANIEFQGRLRPTQTKLSAIDIPLRGQSGGPTPQYQIKVYVEGMGATPVYTGPLASELTGTRILVSLTDGDLTAQPTGEKRYFIVVETTLDAGETMRVGNPYVRQE